MGKTIEFEKAGRGNIQKLSTNLSPELNSSWCSIQQKESGACVITCKKGLKKYYFTNILSYGVESELSRDATPVIVLRNIDTKKVSKINIWEDAVLNLNRYHIKNF
jgi:hypothetical protein